MKGVDIMNLKEIMMKAKTINENINHITEISNIYKLRASTKELVTVYDVKVENNELVIINSKSFRLDEEEFIY